MYCMMNENGYLDALREILIKGERRVTRNSVTISLFSVKLDFDLRNQFPLLTTKKMYWKGIVQELLWFILADTNSKHLEETGVNIWKGNSNREFLDKRGLETYEEGDCGPIYGFQWRHFGASYDGMHANYDGKGVDQLQNCIDLLKNDPSSRRIFMSAWNPVQLEEMCLPPCHVSYQFYVSNNKELSCILYQRSGDMFLGVPFNIASASLLTYILAHMTGLKPGQLTIHIGDAHIYENHIEQVKVQLERSTLKFPTLKIDHPVANQIEDYAFENFVLENYQSHPTIPAAMIA